jgi:predicted methyltransferase
MWLRDVTTLSLITCCEIKVLHRFSKFEIEDSNIQLQTTEHIRNCQPSINPQNVTINRTIIDTRWRCIVHHQQLQLSTWIDFKKFMQIGHFVFELCACLHFSQQVTLEVNEFHGHLNLKGSPSENAQTKKEIVKISPFWTSYLHFCTFPSLWNLNLTFKVNKFRGHLILEGSPYEDTQAKKSSSKSDHSYLSYLDFCTFPGRWPSNWPSRSKIS